MDCLIFVISLTFYGKLEMVKSFSALITTKISENYAN